MGKDNVEDLIAYCKARNRVCPVPLKWKELWEMLPEKRRKENGWEPALPLILAAWWDTPALSKMIRLAEHIQWAQAHRVFSEVEIYLKNLTESEWHHIGE